MLLISKETIVYILAPTGAVTGGPEALHQLCYKINTSGGKAKMVYVDYSTQLFSGEVRAPFRYRHYATTSAERPADVEQNIVIVPEIWPHILNNFNRIQKCIWWLSVDYGQSANVFSDSSIHHLFQSEYAKNYLIENKACNVYPLYDYLSLSPSRPSEKEKIVIYNPKKGFDTTKKIIDHFENSDIQFIALTGFTRSGLRKVMKRSMVYIDFGDHPGKDRIPREAAIHHNIIVVSTSGSSKFYEDVPIPKEFKISSDNLEQICTTIKGAVVNYHRLTKQFDYYRRVINNQEQEFTLQVKKLFCHSNFNFVLAFKHALGIEAFLKAYFDGKEKMIEKVRVVMPDSIKRKMKRLGVH